MTKLNTLGCMLPAAVICRANGWEVGALLRADALPKETGGPRYIRLTGICESLAIGVGYYDDGTRWGPESPVAEVLDFTARDWRCVRPNIRGMNDEQVGAIIRVVNAEGLASGVGRSAVQQAVLLNPMLPRKEL